MICSFGNLTFDADTPISGYTQDMTLATEVQDQDGGKPATLIKGPELEQQHLTVSLIRYLGITPETMISRFRTEIIKATPGKLVLGGRVIGSYRWMLKSVSIKDAILTARGRLISANAELTFEEYVKAGVKEAASKSASAPGVSNMAVNDVYKVNTPSAADKAEKTRSTTFKGGSR